MATPKPIKMPVERTKRFFVILRSFNHNELIYGYSSWKEEKNVA